MATKIEMPAQINTTAKDPAEPNNAVVLQEGGFVGSSEVEDYTVFSDSLRLYLTYLLGFIIILSTLTATIYFPMIPMLSSHFSVSIQAINLTVTLYAVCQALSPPIFASLADCYGRRPVLLALIAIYAIASLVLSLNRQSYGLLLGMRALQSIGGSATPAIAYGIVADVAVVSRRGKMLGPMLSFCNGISALGPIIGGAVAQSTGAYTWVFLALLAVALICLIVAGFTLPETARSVVGNGSRPAHGLSRNCLPNRWVFQYGSTKQADQDESPANHHHRRPRWTLAMALHSLRIILYPDAAVILWMISTSYSVYYTFQVAISVIFADIYGYNNFEVGLTFLPGLTGMTIGGIIAGKLVDKNFAEVAKQNNITLDREKADDLRAFPIEAARYRNSIFFVALEVGLVIGYGWAVVYRVHPAVPLVMQFFICASSTLLSHTASALLVDVFPKNSSTSYASGQIVRCGLSAASAAVLEPLVKAVGRGWYFTIFSLLVGFSGLVSVEISKRKGMPWRQRRLAT